MNIEEFERKVLNYLKGKLTSQEEKLLFHLIEEDAAKKQHFEDLKRIWNATTADQGRVPPGEIHERLGWQDATARSEANEPYKLNNFQ